MKLEAMIWTGEYVSGRVFLWIFCRFRYDGGSRLAFYDNTAIGQSDYGGAELARSAKDVN